MTDADGNAKGFAFVEFETEVRHPLGSIHAVSLNVRAGVCTSRTRASQP